MVCCGFFGVFFFGLVSWWVLGFCGVDGQVISKNISENECWDIDLALD